MTTPGNIHERMDEILQRHGSGKQALIPLLQAMQQAFNYLPEEGLNYLCRETGFSLAEVMGVATFYSQFRFEPAGEHRVKVCDGTACHVKGAGQVYDALKRSLHIAADQDTDSKREFTIEKVGCLGCCTLAPVVQIDDTTYGHVSPVTARRVVDDFMTRKDNRGKRFEYTGNGAPQGEIRVGLGSCCVASGSDDVRLAVEQFLAANHLNVRVKHVGCVGMCHQVPMLEVLPLGKPERLYANVSPNEVPGIINLHFKPPGLLRRVRHEVLRMLEDIQHDGHWDGVERYALDVRDEPVAAFIGNQCPIATEHRGIINPVDLDEYLSHQGFEGLKRALEMAPRAIIEEIKRSGLRGRGGAGFPTGEKWEAVAARQAGEKYLICNGDEGDPGAFMDRMLLESYPYRIIEGMLIAARATGATRGFFYIRAEYPLAVRRIGQALDRCREKGLLSDNILGSGFGFDITVKEGAGAFVCGEESALIASMEGRRGFPRLRPPYPAEQGLWGKPTLINNTETFAQVPFILQHGHERFASIGTSDSRGTKVFSLAGKVRRGGLIEVPMGVTIRQVVEEIGGGVNNGKKLKAVQVGGPSGGCIPHHLTDSVIDFGSLEEAGAMMGSGGLVVLDDTDCMVDIARYFLSFTQNESCGKCTFCRVGTRRMLDILERLCNNKAKAGELEELEKLAHWTAKGSLCGLGKTAPNPVLSTLRHFRNEYEAHLKGTCPAGKCTALIRYTITSRCIGCTICAQECPEDAIPFNPHNQHEIDDEACTRCDICRQACPSNAIEVS